MLTSSICSIIFKRRIQQLFYRTELSRRTKQARDGHSHADLSNPWGVWVLLIGAQLFARCITHWQQRPHWMFIKQVIRDKTRFFEAQNWAGARLSSSAKENKIFVGWAQGGCSTDSALYCALNIAHTQTQSAQPETHTHTKMLFSLTGRSKVNPSVFYQHPYCTKPRRGVEGKGGREQRTRLVHRSIGSRSTKRIIHFSFTYYPILKLILSPSLPMKESDLKYRIRHNKPALHNTWLSNGAMKP